MPMHAGESAKTQPLSRVLAARRYAAGAGIGRSPTRAAPAERKFRRKQRSAALLSPT